MKYFPAFRKSYTVIIMVVTLCFLLIQCIDSVRRKKYASETGNSKFEQFAGSESCRKCHAGEYNDFILTGHYATSAPSSPRNILGSFEKGQNIFHYHKGLYVSMEKNDSGFYQVEYANGIRKIARKFDITVGSGERGQTYLSWQGNLLTLLPVSYLTSSNSWANNPGQHNQVFFDAPVSSVCLQCHTSYAEVIPFRLVNAPEQFNKKIIYGIACERCHGPAAQHVSYQTENPDDKSGKFIIKPSTFSRAQFIDMCAVCHGGKIKNLKPPFSFQSGKKLSDFYQFDTVGANNLIDVHGNQYGLLKKSKCFQTSQLTCVTCHSPHKNEEGNLQLFSQKCMTCHNEAHSTFCKINPAPKTINANCIDCHMPEQASRSIVLQLENNKIPTAQLLRTHDIAIYPAATKEFIKNEKRKQARLN